MIDLVMLTRCPHCEKENHDELYTDDVDGDTLLKCPDCEGQYVVSWKMHANAVIFPVGKELPTGQVRIVLKQSEEIEIEEEVDEVPIDIPVPERPKA